MADDTVKHTEGPWFLEGNWSDTSKPLGGWISAFPPSGMPLFELTPVTGDSDEIIANARVAVAGAELLKALKELADHFETRMGDWENVEWHDSYNNARAAIANAEGRT